MKPATTRWLLSLHRWCALIVSVNLVLLSLTGLMLPQVDFDGPFAGIVLHLHAELFAGPVGRLLVGVVALALLVSLSSGAVVYGPLMKRFAFGLLRRDRARRIYWADIHKLVGAASFGWLLLVSVTGLCSREPLHFGDYGGPPLKLVWTFFGLTTLALSDSGVWVFLVSRRDRSARRRVQVLDHDSQDLAVGQ